ncbi:tachykinin-3 [Struthio camelus]|uniref:tachykinin-3 n=1 Tax=Struthio camelus TaxID=8801 RepID=UPI003603F6D6
MRSCLVLAVLLSLALRLSHGHGAPAKRGSGSGSGPDPPPPALPRRAPGSPAAAFAALLQRLRAEEAGPGAPQKRDMHDFFVGLMGKRAAQPGRSPGPGPEPEPEQGRARRRCRSAPRPPGAPADGHRARRAAPGDAEPPLRAR